MPGFLEDYGTGEVRRERVVRWLVILALVFTVGGIAGYFFFRTFPAKRSASRFLEALQRQDYQGAYRVWGCETPCESYSFEKFMEDWGPKGEYANLTSASVERARYCHGGVIVTLKPQAGEEVALWYERASKSLGFSPWPVCAEKIPAPQ
jgi:hypothetical protein